VVEETLNRISEVADVDGSPEVVLEKIINTADFVGARYLEAGVAVRGRPELLAPFGFNRLIESEGKAIIGDFVTIVQHPRGAKKQIALRENRIVDVPERFLHYSADTEPGSSGSPVFNDQWEIVALHHASVRAPAHTEFGGS
jgi:endonuclease G